MVSPRAMKAQENARARQAGRDAIADGGPHLADKDGTIVVPSPNYHPEFTKVLRANGFRFEHGLCPWWERDTNLPLDGKRYLPGQWLAWAKTRYAWAWPTREDETED